MNYRKTTIAQLKKGDRYHFLPSAACFEFIAHNAIEGNYQMIRLDKNTEETGYMRPHKEVFIECEEPEIEEGIEEQ